MLFEITETAMIQNLAHARQLVTAIKQFGCRFALDDFGAGASSMLYLRDLPVDVLKIDGSFIRSVDVDPINRALVKSINEIAHIRSIVAALTSSTCLRTSASSFKCPCLSIAFTKCGIAAFRRFPQIRSPSPRSTPAPP